MQFKARKGTFSISFLFQMQEPCRSFSRLIFVVKYLSVYFLDDIMAYLQPLCVLSPSCRCWVKLCSVYRFLLLTAGSDFFWVVGARQISRNCCRRSRRCFQQCLSLSIPILPRCRLNCSLADRNSYCSLVCQLILSDYAQVVRKL